MIQGVPASRAAFSLIELLVVLVIVVVLAGMLLPAARLARQAAKSLQCLSNERQIGVAMQAYLDDNDGWYPTARQDGVSGAFAGQRHWFELLQPYVESDNHDGFAATDRRDLLAGGRNVLRDCPAYTPTVVYAYGYGINGCLLMPGDKRRSYWDLAASPPTQLDWQVARVDRRGSRVLVGESPDWHVTVDNSKYPTRWDPTRHGQVSNYLFCDLHVQPLPASLAHLAISDPAAVP